MNKKLLIIIFFTGLILRIALLSYTLSNNPQGIFYADSPGYFLPVINLVENGVYGIDNSPDPLRPPVYPLICYLASLGGDFPQFIPWIQAIIIYTATFYVIHSLIYQAKKKLLLMAFLAFNVTHITYGTMIMADTLFVLELLLTFKIYNRYGLGIHVGTCLGILHLTRPLAGPIFLSIAIYHLIQKKWSWRPIFYSFSAFCIVLSPWILRNTMTFGHPLVGVLPTHALYKTLVPALKAPGNPDAQKQIKEKLLRESGDLHTNPSKVIAYQREVVFDTIFSHKLEVAKLALHSMAVFLWNPERSSWVSLLQLDPLPGRMQFNQAGWFNKLKWLLSSPAQFVICLFQLIFLIWIWLEVFKNVSRQKTLLYIVLLSITFTFWVSGPSLTARKRMPLLAILPLLASCPLNWGKNRKNHNIL